MSAILNTFTDLEYLEDITYLAKNCLYINITLWLLSLLVGKAWPVDFIWSSFPIYLLSFLLYDDCYSSLEFCSWKPFVTLIVTSIWGLRLTFNFINRGGIGHEDWRYTDMRKQFGKGYNLISFVTVFAAQSTFMFVGCLPLFVIARASNITTPSLIIGSCISLTGVLLEIVADGQMDTFVALKKSKQTKNLVLDTGLWKWSRHPNYCGELMFWWGTYVTSLRNISSLTSIGIIGPLLMSVLFFGISVGLMEDRQIKNKKQEYQEYIRKVPSAIVLLPPGCCSKRN